MKYFTKFTKLIIFSFLFLFLASGYSHAAFFNVGPQRDTATFTVSASDSLHKNTADFICDGVDDQVQIQAAIDALPVINSAKSGKIVFLEGMFSISETIQIHGNLMIEGMGIDTTYLKLAANANCDMFSDSAMTSNQLFFSLKEMKIDGNKDYNTAGIGINLGSGAHYNIDVHFDHLWINKFSDDAIKMQQKCWGYLFNNLVIEYNEGNGITIINTNGNSDFKVHGSKIIANDGHGIYLEDPYEAIVADCRLSGGANHYGVYIGADSASNKIMGCSFSGGAANSEGIRIAGDGNIIANNVISGANNFLYGINILEGANWNRITSNRISGSVTANVLNNGIDNIFTSNFGYNNEKYREKGFMGDGSATTVNVTHELGSVPSIVLISPMNDDMQDTSGEYYISAKDATTFTVTFKTAPPAAWHVFYWCVKL